MRVIHKIAVAGAVMATLVGVGMGTASADPSSTPPPNAIVGVNCPPLFVGSPTENVSPAIVPDYNATRPADPMACWDAVNPRTGAPGDPIFTKSGCASTARPNGFSAGITALNANTLDGTTGDYCIDFAFSDVGPNQGATDTFISLAHDAIDWSYPKGTSNPQPSSLTLADLKAIYLCTDTNWSQVGGQNAPIVPVLPQAGSGTRATFLKALGITASSEPCWINGTDPFSSSAPAIEENTGLSTGNVDVFNHSGSFNWPLNQTTGQQLRHPHRGHLNLIHAGERGGWAGPSRPM